MRLVDIDGLDKPMNKINECSMNNAFNQRNALHQTKWLFLDSLCNKRHFTKHELLAI